MTKLRVLRSELESHEARLRVLRSELTTPSIATARIRVLRSELSTPPFTAISLGPNRVADGLDLVTIDATWVGAPPTGWAWSVQSVHPFPVTILPDGPQCVVVAPATDEGTIVKIGAVATNGTTSTELATVDVTVYPHLEWTMVGGVWVPFFDDVID